ncbi:hypothetical protein [Rhizobium leguminosarum]|uniref:hypothetical protein n=1 Tax=Rhizobium leguminosarum TaxID=384 RepID=UPI0002E507E1
MFGLLQLLRFTLPIATSPDVPSGYFTGLGDLTLMELFILPKHGDVTLGVGPLLVVPTVTDESLGSGSTDIQFGGCDSKVTNCLQIMPSSSPPRLNGIVT